MKKKLRIGVFLATRTIEAWQAHCIKAIKESHGSELVLVLAMTDHGSFKTAKSSLLNMFSLYSKMDYKLFKLEPNAFEKKSLDLFVDRIFNIPFNLEEDQYVLSSDALQLIKEFEVDLMINLNTSQLKNNIATSGLWGIWQFYFGDHKKGYGKPMGFWEVIHKEGDTSLELVMNLSKGDGKSLYLGTSLTQFKSVSRNQQNILWKTPSILKRELEKLYLEGKKDYLNGKLPSANLRSQSSLLGYPTNFKMFGQLLNMVLRIAKDMYIKRTNILQWILLMHEKNTVLKKTELQKFRRIYPPKDRYWADPFLFIHEGKQYVFFEELYYHQQKGFISVFEIDEKGEYTDPVKALELDYHISYPFVFEEGGAIYMIPESSSNRTVQLFKSTSFPLNWKLEKTLMKDIIAVDTTVLKYNGKFWLFTNVSGHEGTSTYDDLYLFYSDELITDQWKSHPQNPIVTDVKNARPAGKIFSRDGILYRPAQNCSHHYGYGIQINEILEISETRYKEKIVESILPDWADDLMGTHTINSNDQFVIADALIKR